MIQKLLYCYIFLQFFVYNNCTLLSVVEIPLPVSTLLLSYDVRVHATDIYCSKLLCIVAVFHNRYH